MTMHLNRRFVMYLILILLGISNWKPIYYFFRWSGTKIFGYGRTRFKENIPVLQVEWNCGVPYKCPKNSFPLFLSTSSAKDNRPLLCVADKYVIKPKRKNEARGINAVTVDPDTFQVVSLRTFNITTKNHSLEISKWVNGIQTGDIIIIFTSDEPSFVQNEARVLLNSIGSGRVQNLQYRSHWYMITQKGTPGITVYEKITYSKKKDWGAAIEFRGCIPKKIPKKFLTVDDPLKQDRNKVEFCKGKSQEEYKGFCNEPRFETIVPALLTNRSLVKHEVYATPIFLFASSHLEVFLSSLDNMIHQPGVNMSLITVLYEGSSNDVPDIAKIYGARCSKTKFSITFEGRLKQARILSRNMYPEKKYLLVLDEGVIPSPDFLYFFSQLLPVFEKDNTVSAICGWSCNCYSHNGSLQMVYRVISAPKYGALISAKLRGNEFNKEIFAPDVARLQGPEACHLPSLDANARIDRPQDLSKDLYYHKLVMIQQQGHVIKEEDVLSFCSTSVIKKKINVLYMEFKGGSLSKILYCLGILNNKYNEYKGVVRLTVNGKAVTIITRNSSFYKSRPKASEVVSKGVKI